MREITYLYNSLCEQENGAATFGDGHSVPSLNAAVYASAVSSRALGIPSSAANIARQNNSARRLANARQRKARRRVCRSRRAVLTVAALALIALICYGANSLIAYAINAYRPGQEASSSGLQRYYTDIIVQPNETLWDIAQEYFTDNCSSIYAYMDEIMELNRLGSEYLTYGQHLAIPYYR